MLSSARMPITTTSHAGCTPACCNAATAANPATTPAAPSKFPPFGTLSKWDPITICRAARFRPGQVM